MEIQNNDKDLMALMIWHRTKRIANSTTHIRSFIKTEGNHLSTEDGILMLETEKEGHTFGRIVLPTNEVVKVFFMMKTAFLDRIKHQK